MISKKESIFFTNKIHDDALEQDFFETLENQLVKDKTTLRGLDAYNAMAIAIRNRLIKRWLRTQDEYRKQNAKRVYYLSMEFLMGRLLGNMMINLDVKKECADILRNIGYNVEDIEELEPDMGLGNGGLGRLAACFLDSMATLGLPAFGYGIRYEYGIFKQDIKNGRQIENPDNWLRYGSPWEIVRPVHEYRIRFGGKVKPLNFDGGNLKNEWSDTEDVLALAYDVPVPAYGKNNVINLRLWQAKSTNDFDFKHFNEGDYIAAVGDKNKSENISKVLYPNDNNHSGKILRLKQQYFFVSASLQDIIRRYKVEHHNFDLFNEKIAIQLNDTHPTIAIPELMRIFIDEEGLEWDRAWSIVAKTFAYTNHTVLPEALEKWSLSIMEELLPRHVQIIFEINSRFLDEVRAFYNFDLEKVRKLSIIEEGYPKHIRMANLAIVASFSINGVSALHSEILKDSIFHDFYQMMPEKFNNKTNGITQRRWLKSSNPYLSKLITDKIGGNWAADLYDLKKIESFADDPKFRQTWQKAKHQAKKNLIRYIEKNYPVTINPDSIFDVQVKRLHEYKRQLLNVLHVITLYNRIKANPNKDFVPRTIMFGGKAAPGYYMAKLIIKLVNSVADKINNDPDVGNKLKVLFLKNYSVSLAEKIIPAADLSEQISTAGLEASGTGNMKFQLNGALTIGTLDGANIEIKEEVGDENIFIFGLKAEEVTEMKQKNYVSATYYESDPELRKVLDMLKDDYFNEEEPGIFEPIFNTLVNYGDTYFVLADYRSYIEAQEKVSETYRNIDKWTKMSILNTARSGKFSSDRTIKEYADEIWKIKPVDVNI